jgi:hypothetical protein
MSHVAEAYALHMFMCDFEDELGAQRFPLEHDPLVGMAGEIDGFGDHAVETGTFEALNQSVATLRSLAMSSSGSSTHVSGSCLRMGSSISGKQRLSDISSRLCRRISSPSRKTATRQPSHLGSQIQLPSEGIAPTRLASMGRIDRLTGSFKVASFVWMRRIADGDVRFVPDGALLRVGGDWLQPRLRNGGPGFIQQSEIGPRMQQVLFCCILIVPLEVHLPENPFVLLSGEDRGNAEGAETIAELNGASRGKPSDVSRRPDRRVIEVHAKIAPVPPIGCDELSGVDRIANPFPSIGAEDEDVAIPRKSGVHKKMELARISLGVTILQSHQILQNRGSNLRRGIPLC